MTENDPAATFRADQEAADTEHRTREQVSWDLNVRNGEAQALGAEAHAYHSLAKARFWRLAGNGLIWLALTLILLGVLGFFGVGTWS